MSAAVAVEHDGEVHVFYRDGDGEFVQVAVSESPLDDGRILDALAGER